MTAFRVNVEGIGLWVLCDSNSDHALIVGDYVILGEMPPYVTGGYYWVEEIAAVTVKDPEWPATGYVLSPMYRNGRITKRPEP